MHATTLKTKARQMGTQHASLSCYISSLSTAGVRNPAINLDSNLAVGLHSESSCCCYIIEVNQPVVE